MLSRSRNPRRWLGDEGCAVPVREVHYTVDVNTLQRREEAKTLGRNDIGKITIHTTTPLVFDKYSRNRNTGSLILIDEGTNETVAAGMIA